MINYWKKKKTFTPSQNVNGEKNHSQGRPQGRDFLLEDFARLSYKRLVMLSRGEGCLSIRDNSSVKWDLKLKTFFGY